MYTVTGSFNNPGPYGGFLAMVASIFAPSIYDKIRKKENNKNLIVKLLTFVFVVSLFLAQIIISGSRGAFVSLLVSLFFMLFKFVHTKKGLRNLICMGTFFLIIVFVLCFSYKKNSAIGRLHIWNMECRAIVKYPFGTGYGSFGRTYGDIQESYFKSKERNANTIQIAGCPEYPFNEYLGIGVEFGVVGLLFFAALLFMGIQLLYRMNSPLSYGLIAFSVFAFFSYPLHVPLIATFFTCSFGVVFYYLLQCRKQVHANSLLKVILVVITVLPFCFYSRFLAAKRVSEGRWREAKKLMMEGRVQDAVSEYNAIKEFYCDNYIFLFDFGVALNDARLYSESNDILQQGANMSCDPMFHNVMGDNYLKMGNIVAAESEYWRAYYMVPCRLYPLYKLIQLYISQGQIEQALQVRRKALQQPVNDKNMLMKKLHDEISDLLFLIK